MHQCELPLIFQKKKLKDKERILIFGDSVIWGTSQIDQEKIYLEIR